MPTPVILTLTPMFQKFNTVLSMSTVVSVVLV